MYVRQPKIGLGLGYTSGGQYTPASLFTAGEQGFYYDPSDFSTLFQDTAGTVPVTAVGQSVARINDKSGLGNHATQSNASQRPILRQNGSLYYLEFDGTDDFLVTGTIAPGTDKAQVFAALRTVSQATTGVVAEISAHAALNTGTFVLLSPSGVAVQGISYSTRGDAAALSVATANSVGAAPVSHVITAQSDISTDTATIRLNGIEAATSAADQGAGNYGNYSLFIGSRNGSSRYLNGHVYALIGRFGPNLTTVQIEATEHWMANKIGVSL